MDDEHRQVHSETLRMFLSKLEIVTAILQRLQKQASNESGLDAAAWRVKYAFKKEGLDKAIEELEIWQRTADQSWFLLMKMADPQIDAALARYDATVDHLSVAAAIPSTIAIRSGLQEAGTSATAGSGLTINAEELSRMSVWPVPYSHALCAQRLHSTGETTTYVLNNIRCQPLAKYNVIKKDARDLVRKLQHKDPSSFGLLSCKGLATPSSVPVATPGAPEPEVTFTIVFRAPPCAGEPRSLRDLLLHTATPSSLSTKFDMARELAKSVSFVHTFGFVHKNIRPESVLVYPGGSGQDQSMFLLGLENFRREDGWTQRRGDDALDRNLYRHPSRQGDSPQEDYVMQHDIYSLGVCLLEIGFWNSFVQYDAADGRPIPSDLLGLPPSASPTQLAYVLQTSGTHELLRLARSQLPRHMGTKYAEIVETCLTCLEPYNADFGDAREFEDEDGIRVGARYIAKVSTSRQKAKGDCH